jgi:hypothetical protein
VVEDWYDGRIDDTYPLRCYREAIKHLPEDVQAYSDAPDAINRALQSRMRSQSGGEPAEPRRESPREESGSGAAGTLERSLGGDDPGESSNPSRQPEGPVRVAIDKLGPENADSVPLPLIVLAAVAGLLMAGGAAALVARRLHARRAGESDTLPGGEMQGPDDRP